MASALRSELKASIDWMIGQQKEFSLQVQQWIGENMSLANTLVDIPAFSFPQGFYEEIVRRIQKQGSPLASILDSMFPSSAQPSLLL